MGESIPWFTGNPELQARIAEIKAERQLKALGQLTSVPGRIVGEYRRQQEESDAVKRENATLGETLGLQAEKAKTESEPQTPGTDTSQASPQEQSALQRLAASAQTFLGKAGHATLSTFGLASPHAQGNGTDDDPGTVSVALDNARMQGRVKREGMDLERLNAMQPIMQRAEHPGRDVVGPATNGRFNIGDPKMVPPRSASAGNGPAPTIPRWIQAAVDADPTLRTEADRGKKALEMYQNLLLGRQAPGPAAGGMDPLQQEARRQLALRKMQEAKAAGQPLSEGDAYRAVPQEEVDALSDAILRKQNPTKWRWQHRHDGEALAQPPAEDMTPPADPGDEPLTE